VPLLYADLECRDAVELATDYLEGALSWRQRRSYEHHVRNCPDCRAHFEQIRAVAAALGAVEPEALSPAAQQDLMDVFRRYREDHGHDADDEPPDGSS
jgi:predicted anti-sigma-YlaC factor YlaD